ncbi:MAG: tRNA (adenosine(37)-N6)-threonylcarbamoyltransferase complex dimerization subunit type 1 TsaB [Ruminococcaceae bacterium]|nr:tRNA (adenosine(37)-N6)-threonylcarbamoyltransferase complex dimerization subunit type 1 TsaB [Oscillospiraceae bacterium]
MRILAVETSAGPASCAVVEDGKVIASSYNNTAQTHSQTLMPMVEEMLKQAGLTVSDMDRLAVSAGPGSFTGVRIGVAAVKGMAFAENKPCVGVSTLAAIARNARGIGFEGVVCAAMDARCRQVYTACFLAQNGEISRLSADEAISTDELKACLVSYDKPILLFGDGALLCYREFCGEIDRLLLAPEHLRYQTAVGVAHEARECEAVTAEMLQPLYLRLPQAERELKARQQLQG